MQTLCLAKTSPIRFLVTTRGYPEIIKLFKGFSQGCILLAGENKSEVDQIQQDIALVAAHKLNKLAAPRKFTDKRTEEMQNILMRKVGQQRTYLWVRLVFEVLESNLQDRWSCGDASLTLFPRQYMNLTISSWSGWGTTMGNVS